jgi:hypothetical protein
MMRATGFLLGTLLVLAAFLFVLGDGTAPSPLPVNRAAATSPPAGPATAEEDGIPPLADTAGVDEKNSLEVSSSRLELGPPSGDESLAVHAAVSRNDAVSNDILPADTSKASRYRVWSPFHSKWAAEGFAEHLSQATAVPVEVVNAGAGNYQVVFSYQDDGERQALVERIETITGLELE